jgi:HD-GYP domain-containing protein (c-di-GMP phosphodiesterase class II)
MRLVPTLRVQEGSELARDVVVARPDGIPLLRAGVKITSGYRDRLVKEGIHAIYIEDDASQGITPEQIVSDETRAIATRAVADAYTSVQGAITYGRPLGSEMVDSLNEVVALILAEVQQSGGVAVALSDLACADAYTFQHSIDVTAVGLLLGQRFFRDHGWTDFQGQRRFSRMDERLSQLGLGLMLHDIGKLAIPTSILNKPGRLDAHEWEIMKAHPRTGMELLSGSGFSPLVKAIVLRHHERWDGSGYPGGRSGEGIHQMARIAAIADVYDAITSERPYAPARPAHIGVRAILDGAGRLFDPEVTAVFAQLVAPYPPGVEIELSDGRRGIVVSVPEGALDRPVVRILDGPGAPCELPLQRNPTIRIAGWDPDPLASAAPVAA